VVNTLQKAKAEALMHLVGAVNYFAG
jgi:hypothetical protein